MTNKLEEAIKVLFENGLSVSNGFYALYQADGEFMTKEDDIVWVISGWVDNKYYKEFSNREEAIRFFIRGEFD